MTLLLIFAGGLFMAINVIISCYIAVRLGFGPPDWKTALNLVVRVTTLQDRLNAGRDWLGKKVPKADKLLDRLHIPKPIIIVEEPEESEKPAEEEQTGETDKTEQTGENDKVSAEDVPAASVAGPLDPKDASVPGADAGGKP